MEKEMSRRKCTYHVSEIAVKMIASIEQFLSKQHREELSKAMAHCFVTPKQAEWTAARISFDEQLPNIKVLTKIEEYV